MSSLNSKDWIARNKQNNLNDRGYMTNNDSDPESRKARVIEKIFVLTKMVLKKKKK
jgi:hypothetical protein